MANGTADCLSISHSPSAISLTLRKWLTTQARYFVDAISYMSSRIPLTVGDGRRFLSQIAVVSWEACAGRSSSPTRPVSIAGGNVTQNVVPRGCCTRSSTIPVRFGDPLRDRQSEPGALGASGWIELHEAI